MIFVLISSSKIIAIKLISPSWYYYIQIFTLFPIQTLRLGIFSISLDFIVLKTYCWSVCFCLDSNFVHTLLFALSILNFCGFCSWIWKLKCYVKIEFVVLCIACIQCDCRCICIGISAQWMVKESSNFTICGIESKNVSWWVSEWVAGSW